MSPTIPPRLLAPAPGWTRTAEAVVIGSGIAGLVAALRIRQSLPADSRVLLVTKALLDEGSTRWAQGGIAAALDPADDPEDHLRDTLVAGAGLCDEDAVRTLVTEGPDAVRRLIALGALFDRNPDGTLALTREGGHHRRRIVHAGGDASGAEISRALLAALKHTDGIDVIENALVLDILTTPTTSPYGGGASAGGPYDAGADAVSADAAATGERGPGVATAHDSAPGAQVRGSAAVAAGIAPSTSMLPYGGYGAGVAAYGEGNGAGVAVRRRVVGITLHVMGEGQRDGVGAVLAPAVVLATGGLGQVFAATTNPSVSTGDGVALALRAGAEVADLEFVQFHPTVFWLGEGATGQQPLISEAVRGEGAYLVDADGVRFMVGRHELAELAPRDVVAKGIMARMLETGASHMFLDGRHLGARVWEERFPTILEICRSHGVDPLTEPIPIVPAAHFASGGVRTDRHGRTTVPGLYACGEVACTGVHGANRLASNSLLEGLVFAERIAQALPADRSDLPAHAAPAPTKVAAPAGVAVDVDGVLASACALVGAGVLGAEVRGRAQEIMSEYCGVLRNAEGLARAAAELGALAGLGGAEPCVEAWEATNLHTVATAIVAAARRRLETRGSHWREDFPGKDDERWHGHLVTRVGPGGVLETSFEEMA